MQHGLGRTRLLPLALPSTITESDTFQTPAASHPNICWSYIIIRASVISVSWREIKHPHYSVVGVTSIKILRHSLFINLIRIKSCYPICWPHGCIKPLLIIMYHDQNIKNKNCSIKPSLTIDTIACATFKSIKTIMKMINSYPSIGWLTTTIGQHHQSKPSFAVTSDWY